MTEKRFTTVELPKPNRWGIWYDGAYLSTYQVCILLNEYVDVKKENEQLKSELSRYKEVNRLDIWKSSYSSEDALITELQNKSDKKQEHIVVLENKIRRMREAIHKLEWLATHRNADLMRENEQLKEQNQRLSEQKHIYKQDWKHLCIDKELLDSENEQLQKELESFKPIIFESDGKPVTLYKKGDVE